MSEEGRTSKLQQFLSRENKSLTNFQTASPLSIRKISFVHSTLHVLYVWNPIIYDIYCFLRAHVANLQGQRRTWRKFSAILYHNQGYRGEASFRRCSSDSKNKYNDPRRTAGISPAFRSLHLPRIAPTHMPTAPTQLGLR